LQFSRFLRSGISAQALVVKTTETCGPGATSYDECDHNLTYRFDVPASIDEQTRFTHTEQISKAAYDQYHSRSDVTIAIKYLADKPQDSVLQENEGVGVANSLGIMALPVVALTLLIIMVKREIKHLKPSGD
jgi:hypothetical protein